jgi:hypothetical protein
MLGFIVRKCTIALGRPPTPEEFADWANSQEEKGRRYNLFGRAISPSTAEVMLRHLGRSVVVRSNDVAKSSKVIDRRS